MKKLADEIINGRRLSRNDDLSFLTSAPLTELCREADRIRKHFVGDKADLCAIINARSGKCPENCAYCAQSAHYKTNCQVYSFLPEEKILEAARIHDEEGVDRFSIVTAGRALDGKEFAQAVSAYKAMRDSFGMKLCASMGFLSKEQFDELKEAGVTTYHHNIETSRRFFPKICTTHTYDDKIRTLRLLKETGWRICSGGIIGMGETMEDRIDMALDLAEIGVDSIPINSLMPIKGTPLENQPTLSEDEILRTVAIFRWINPQAQIRLAAGRALMSEDGRKAFESGASATITGNMLTTAAKATIKSDRKMLSEIGRATKEISR